MPRTHSKLVGSLRCKPKGTPPPLCAWRVREWGKHKEHSPVWAATSDALHSGRRPHPITQCHLSLLGHRVQEVLIHPAGGQSSPGGQSAHHWVRIKWTKKKKRLFKCQWRSSWNSSFLLDVNRPRGTTSRSFCARFRRVILYLMLNWLQKLAGASPLRAQSVLRPLIMQRGWWKFNFQLECICSNYLVCISPSSRSQVTVTVCKQSGTIYTLKTW